MLAGCGETKETTTSDFLIKTRLITVSTLDFIEELDRKHSAYPYNIKEFPAEYNEMVIDLVKILSQEIVLLSAAADKQITVTDQEAMTAEKEFKKEYPKDSFDKIILEEAISYPLWKNRFKKNMIIEKLVEQELKGKIEIKPSDIVQFYNNSYKTTLNSQDSDSDLNKKENEKELVAELRTQKTQENYNEWVQNLYKTYPVEINRDKLKSLLMNIKENKGHKNEKKS